MIGAMRWDHLRLDEGLDGPADGGLPAPGRGAAGAAGAVEPGVPLTLFERGAVTRRFDTPEFRGMTFYEIHAKSIVNQVPGASRVPFRWTINPYRGCQHACFYCFARNTHTYLDLDAGADFNSKVVVKVNAPELLRKTLASPRWQGEHIAMGTNVDCYQRAEGRYRLMPGIIAALRDVANPFSILTKGTLILRDLDLLCQAAEVTEVGLNVSAGFVDKELWRSLEPGTPSPERRLDACAALTGAGLRCGVLMGPVMPFLSDSPAQLDAAVRLIAEAGAAHVSPIVLHLRPGAREWFLQWLRERHPALLPRYRALYGHGAYAPKDYQARIAGQVRELAQRYGVGAASPAATRAVARGSQAAPQKAAGRMAGAHRAPGQRSARPADEAAGTAGPSQLSLL
jgi:DNA repair photolyase